MTRRIDRNVQSRVGDDLVEAFDDMARYLRGEIDLEYYEVEYSAVEAEGAKPAVKGTPADKTV